MVVERNFDNWTWLRHIFKNTVKDEDEMANEDSSSSSKTADVFQVLVFHMEESSEQEMEVSKVERRHQMYPSPSPSPVVQHLVPDHTPTIDKIQMHEEGGFQTLWSFEDLHMLIGADLPVFSVGDRPACVHIRLRDGSQPICVVTGLEYWLDSLMCSVPEVAMCFRDSGFVQKYELIKTEDISKLELFKFSQQTVKYVASNILSFLRNSATKEGHTYWFYKCQRSDLVKLYDLTTLCESSVPHTGVTPFTIPVAMLLYRLGRKLRLKSNCSRHTPEIKALLQTSSKLLEETDQAEVCTSSLYLLSDLYIPDSCLRDKWVDDSSKDTPRESEDEEGEEEEESQPEVSVLVKDLMSVRRTRLEGITGTSYERCKDGLQCLHKGLSCLERDLQAKTLQSERSSSSIVEEQRTCNSSEAIPLKYEPLQQMALAAETKVLVQRSTIVTDSGPETWHKLTKALLLRKASMANYILATELLAKKQYGCSLKHIRYAIHCFEAVASLKPTKKTENGFLLMLLLRTTSEVRYHLATSNGFEDHQRGYDDVSEEDNFILDSAQSTLSVPELAWVYKWTTDKMENCCIALRCLDTTREVARHQPQTSAVRDLIQDVTKKTSAVCNELGKIAMMQADEIISHGSTFEDIEEVWKQSMDMFERGLEGFCKVKDAMNEVIILINIFRLHGVATKAHLTNVSTREFRAPVLHHLEEACKCCKKALQRLDTSDKKLRNAILFGFSKTYWSIGAYLKIYPRSMSDPVKEAVDMYRKAIRKCEQIVVEIKDDMWLLCKDKIATMEYDLALLRISSYSHQSEIRRNRVFAQAEGSFKKAADLFHQAGKHYKFLQVQCKRLDLYNKHYDSSEKNPQVLDLVLTLFVNCEGPLLAASSSGFPDSNKLGEQADYQEPGPLLDCLLRSTLIVLKQLLKRARQLKKTEEQQLKEAYRKGLELQSQLKEASCTMESKFQLMAQLAAHIRHHCASTS